jgi:hypothetical protein
MDVRRIFVAIGLVAVCFPHTVFGAGQAGWSSGTQQPTGGFDRYNNQASGAPSISQRAQTAISDTGSSLRDGMEAGIRAGEQTLGGANSQSTYSNGGVASPWPSTTSSAAPAWPATTNTGTGMVPLNSANPASTAGAGWSSIGTGIPAPKLVVPQSPMMTPNGIGTTTNFGNGGTQGGRGPNFPAVAAHEQPQYHSVLSDPSRTAASPNAISSSPANDWVNTWNNNPPTQPASTGRGNGVASTGSLRDSDMVSLPNVPNSGQESGPGVASRLNENPSGNDSWNLPQNAGSSFSKNGTSAVSPPPFVGSPNTGAANNGQFANQTNGQGFGNPMQNGPINGGFAQAGLGTGFNTAGNGQMQNGAPNGMQNGMSNGSQNGTNQFGRNEVGANGPVTNQPLFTWVLVVLTLAGSLAANFYLGASYLDARQKYQSLVRKTAETFRRVKAAAA